MYAYICIHHIYIFLCMHTYIYISQNAISQPQHQCQAIYGTADRGAADQDDRTYRPVSLS